MTAHASVEKEDANSFLFDYKAHAWRRRVCRILFTYLLSPTLSRIETVEGLENIPKDGPAILYYNHIAFLDPFFAMRQSRRDLIPMAKVEAFSYPVIGHLPRFYGIIPVNRGEVDRKAIRMSEDVIKQGQILLISPEGTRSDALIEAKIGTVFIASHTNFPPMVPVAVDGTIGFPTYPFSKRWRAEGVRIRFGKPFRFTPSRPNPDKLEMQQMTDEMMYIISALLPPNRRGHYNDLTLATQRTIEWI